MSMRVKLCAVVVLVTVGLCACGDDDGASSLTSLCIKADADCETLSFEWEIRGLDGESLACAPGAGVEVTLTQPQSGLAATSLVACGDGLLVTPRLPRESLQLHAKLFDGNGVTLATVTDVVSGVGPHHLTFDTARATTERALGALCDAGSPCPAGNECIVLRADQSVGYCSPVCHTGPLNEDPPVSADALCEAAFAPGTPSSPIGVCGFPRGSSGTVSFACAIVCNPQHSAPCPDGLQCAELQPDIFVCG